MYRNLVGFGMRHGINKEKKYKYKVGGGVEMTGKGELWHLKEEKEEEIQGPNSQKLRIYLSKT